MKSIQKEIAARLDAEKENSLTRTTEDVKQQIRAYIKLLTDKHKEYNDKHGFAWVTNFSEDVGSKFARIKRQDNQISVHCFIDLSNGDILKAAGYKKPAKGKRGNIFDENPPVFLEQFYR